MKPENKLINEAVYYGKVISYRKNAQTRDYDPGIEVDLGSGLNVKLAMGDFEVSSMDKVCVGCSVEVEIKTYLCEGNRFYGYHARVVI
jgi:hypothetical protein